MPTDDQTAASPLIRALVDVAISAARNKRRQLRYAIDHDEPLYEACACREVLGLQQCDCRVVLGMGHRWMRSAAERLERGEGVGVPPKRRCRLCRAGDHDLADTHEVTISVAGQPGESTVRMISPRRRRTKELTDRATRAGAHPPSVLEEQRQAAGLD